MTDRPRTIGRAEAAGGGELVLRVRPGAGPGRTDGFELIVDGVFAMDTVQVSSELALAAETLARLPGRTDGWRVVLGGLGLGYTLRELLADRRVSWVEVVELEPALVTWVRDGRVSPAAGLLDDPRVTVVVADIGAHLAGLPAGSADAILLDVDNGPDFLVHQSNSRLYDPAALSTAMQGLRPGGRLAVWSASPSSELEARLRDVAGSVDVVTLPARREGRTFDYVVYLALAAGPH
jgi:spermidine synthase